MIPRATPSSSMPRSWRIVSISAAITRASTLVTVLAKSLGMGTANFATPYSGSTGPAGGSGISLHPIRYCITKPKPIRILTIRDSL
eukprot:UN03696